MKIFNSRLVSPPILCRLIDEAMDKRHIQSYGNHFDQFYADQDQKVKDKIDWTLDQIRTLDHVPADHLKHLVGSDGLYEIRIHAEGNQYRIFCFFAHDNKLVLLNGIQKKSRKTHHHDIAHATELKHAFLENWGG